METGDGAAVLEGLSVEVDDLFTAGDRAAAAVTLRGTYAGGLPGGAAAAADGTAGHDQTSGETAAAVDATATRTGRDASSS